MKLNLTTLQDGQTVKEFQLPADTFASNRDIPSLTTPVSVKIEIFRHDDRITVTGHVQCKAMLSCSRCLEPVEAVLDGDYLCNYEPDPQVNYSSDEKELAEEELDVVYYRGADLDLDQQIAECLVLSIPMQPLCNESCRGLCPQCGSNRNVMQCQCRDEEEPHPFDQLKNIKLN